MRTIHDNSDDPPITRNVTPRGSRGFTMVEIAITILIMGMLFALSVPTIQTLSSSYVLKGATENLAAHIRLHRERAIVTGQLQHFHFSPAVAGGDYYIINHSTGFIPVRWRYPKGVTYSATSSLGWIDMRPDGRASFSGNIILRDRRGNLDTVFVQTSGLVLTK